MNNFRNSPSLSVPRDLSHGSCEGNQAHPPNLSHGSSEGKQENPPKIISPALQNHNSPTLNMGNNSSSSGDACGGATVCSTVKPRGRPRGSRNRSKQESKDGPKGENTAAKAITLHVPDGVDLIEWLAGFAKSNKVCITVIGGFGNVSLAVLGNLVSQAPPLLYKEYLTVISLTGTYLFSSLEEGTPNFLNASLARVTGVVIAGEVLRMVTMDKVVLSAYIFQNPKVLAVESESH